MDRNKIKGTILGLAFLGGLTLVTLNMKEMMYLVVEYDKLREFLLLCLGFIILIYVTAWLED